MAEKQSYNSTLTKIGEMLENKRKALGEAYKTRAKFIEIRSSELFSGNPWISERHLTKQCFR